MSTREQFGKYLLLKKLTEDPLGETFRAGLLGSSGMEQLTFLRIWNGQGVDGSRLWQSLEGRGGVQEILKNPNIGQGLDFGEIEGIPYVAYEYVSGKNLANLLAQATKKRDPIPTEHALLISDRLALALAGAFETRYEGQRLLHGFVVPHLALISNEGETRLLGFEAGSGLAGFSTNPVIRQHFGRYLAPEVLAGGAPEAVDDIYSLGVVLFELLTGKPLPPAPAEGYAAVIDQGILAAEEEPIPEALRSLLKQSLVPRGERIADVMTWHKTLSSWMFESEHNPTTFNLAFFMHNLFRQEIESETQEIEAEKTLPIPVVKTPPQRSAEPPAVSPDSAAISEGTGAFMTGPPAEEKKSKIGVVLALVAIVILALGVGGYFWWSSQQAAEEPPVVAEPVPPPPPEPEGPTQEELQAQMQALIDKQATAMEGQIRSQYEEELKQLEAQLGETKRLAEEQRQRELDRQAEEEARIAAEKAAEEEAARLAAEKAAEEEAAEEAARLAAAAPPPPPPEKIAPPPPPPPPKPTVRRGDLVEMGPGVTPPTTLRLEPRFPEMARRLNKDRATVIVKVLVDENGRAVEAEVIGKKSGFGFDAEALRAVRKATFRPPTKDGVPVKLWYTLTVQFKE